MRLATLRGDLLASRCPARSRHEAWEVPLCEAYGPDNATTSLRETLGGERLLARLGLVPHECTQ